MSKAPLLPKLRGHFAEFLQHGSLKRLSILYLFTCVGLGNGIKHEVFSWKLLPSDLIHYNKKSGEQPRHSRVPIVIPPFGVDLGTAVNNSAQID
jgi:hypothetical protein